MRTDSTRSSCCSDAHPAAAAAAACVCACVCVCAAQDVVGVADSLKCLFALQQQQQTLEAVLQQLAADACKPLPAEALRAAAAAAIAPGSPKACAAPAATAAGAAGSQHPAAAAAATFCESLLSRGSGSISLVCCTPFQQLIAEWGVSIFSSLETKLRQAFLLDQVYRHCCCCCCY